MDKQFMVVLWNDVDTGEKQNPNDPHLIDYFETLKEAVVFLVKHGAHYDHQELVQRVDWMPGDTVVAKKGPAMVTQTPVLTPEEIELANKPNPKGTQGEPVVINAQGQPLGGSNRPLAISERIPKGMLGTVLND